MNGGTMAAAHNQLPHQSLRSPAASDALRIIDRLREAGFVAYMAGGCVRDALLGKQPKDYDVATDATPDAVRQVFGKRRTLAFGASFGVIGVLPLRRDRPSIQDSQSNGGDESDVRQSKADDNQAPPANQPTEVATFRSDGFYSDGRRPDSVHFGDAKHDALRRDFTINGLFYDPHDDRVIDYVGGQDDLRAGILRTIGDPSARFGEDKLRMLRAVRFATTLGFTLDPLTLQAIVQHAADIGRVSPERIGAEMRRVLVADRAVDGVRHLIACGLDRSVMPETSDMDLDRGESLLRQASFVDFSLRLASLMTLLPDPGQSLRAIGRRWRLSNEEVRRSAAALQHFPDILNLGSAAWSATQPVLIDRDADVIVELAAAIGAVDGNASGLEGVALARSALAWPVERLNPPPLLTGDDLRELGIPAGPIYSALLRAARNDQLDGNVRTRAEAIARIDRGQQPG